MNDITKLPKWAQDRIRQADGRIASLERKLGQIYGNLETNTHWLDLSPASGEILKPRPIPYGSPIRFSIDKFDYIEVRLDDDGYLNMHGNAAVAVRPEASNHIRVAFRRIQ